MDVILILAITLLIIFIGALFYAKKRQSGFKEFSFLLFEIYLFILNTEQNNNNQEAPPIQRRPGPIDDNRPRAAQIRRRRQFNPARDYDGGVQNDNDDPGKQSIVFFFIDLMNNCLDDFVEGAMNDPVDFGSKIGKKKQLKMQAKEEKRQQREVNK